MEIHDDAGSFYSVDLNSDADMTSINPGRASYYAECVGELPMTEPAQDIRRRVETEVAHWREQVDIEAGNGSAGPALKSKTSFLIIPVTFDDTHQMQELSAAPTDSSAGKVSAVLQKLVRVVSSGVRRLKRRAGRAFQPEPAELLPMVGPRIPSWPNNIELLPPPPPPPRAAVQQRYHREARRSPQNLLSLKPVLRLNKPLPPIPAPNLNKPLPALPRQAYRVVSMRASFGFDDTGSESQAMTMV